MVALSTLPLDEHQRTDQLPWMALWTTSHQLRCIWECFLPVPGTVPNTQHQHQLLVEPNLA
jgi:hypothetical protein